MLSQKNKEKLEMDGLYTRLPDKKYRSKWHEDNLYHCCNWTFNIVENSDGEVFMRDTYWGSGDSLHIKLTDENISDFTLLFKKNDVKRINKENTSQYKTYFTVGIDSGGWSYPKYFVYKDDDKSRDLVLSELDNEIDKLEREVDRLKDRRRRVASGEIESKWL